MINRNKTEFSIVFEYTSSINKPFTHRQRREVEVVQTETDVEKYIQGIINEMKSGTRK